MSQPEHPMDAIARVAGAIAHDFNNLITSMRGLSALALQELPPGHPIRPDLEEIGKASDRAAELTRDLLSFARRGNNAPRPIELNRVVEEAVNRVRADAGPDADVAFSPGARQEVMADPAIAGLIVSNLLLAARAAVRSGGKIELSTARATAAGPDCPPAAGWASVTVRDTGTPIPPEHLGRIFEPFYRRPTGESAGVTLASAFMLARQSGGCATAESGQEGTTVRVFLPLAGPAR